MKFTIEFSDGLIKVMSGCEIQYATEVAFGFNGATPVIHMTRELGEESAPVEQGPKFQYIDGST